MRQYLVSWWFGFWYITDLEKHKSNNHVQHQYQNSWNHQFHLSFNLKWSWENIPPIPYLTSVRVCMGKIHFQARALEHVLTIFHTIYEMRKKMVAQPVYTIKEVIICLQSAETKFSLVSLFSKQPNMNLSSGVLSCLVLNLSM